MPTLSVELSEPEGAFVQRQADARGFSKGDEYVHSLVRQAYQEQSDFEEKVLAGLAAIERGDCREMTAEDWQRLRKEFRERHPLRQAS